MEELEVEIKMSENKNSDLPWQNYPERFIRYASNFKNTQDDFERLIGYLLLDVGVEALLKAYVLADSSLKYEKREASAKGVVGKDTIPDSKITAANFDKITFHNLIETVKLIANSRVSDEELRNAEHYHGIRNIIYHEGRKTIPSVQDFKEYLALAQSFLHRLLGVDSENRDQEEYILYEGIDEGDLMAYHFIDPQKEFNDLRHDILVAITLHRPKYATRALEEKLMKLQEEYADALESGSSSVYQFAKSELVKEFNELTGQKLDNTETILEICNDVTFLQLAVLLTKLGEDVNNEMNKYLRFRKYSMESNYEKRETTKENIEKSNEFIIWTERMQQKINSFIEEKISK